MKNEQQIPWGEIGYLVYKRTYARPLSDQKDSEKEEFHQTVQREIDSFSTQLNLHLSEEEIEKYRKLRMSLKISPAGRFMWQLGTKTVDKLGLLSLQNCAFTVIDKPSAFTWAFDALCLGSGVGFSIQKEHISKLPSIKGPFVIERFDDKSADFIVPDTREGWVKLLGKVLKSAFYSGKGFTYSMQLIRSKGEPIKGFGGVASGPGPLADGLQDIITILNSKAGSQLSSVDCLDIMNIIGSIVVAGNVRRSAQIAIGDSDDVDYLKAKRWSLGNIPYWRGNSNNSVVWDGESELPEEFWQTYEDGEPYGLINLLLSREVGRTGDYRFQDPDIQGFNPCGEQSLGDRETCCLAETYLPNIKNYDELIDSLTLVYKINKHSLALPCHLKETEEIVHKNMRMGIGLTGVLMATDKLYMLEDAYEYLRNLDAYYSELMGWPESIKLTTIKPSGTLSLLAGVTPGIHPSPAGPYYIRRVRMAAEDKLVEVCRSHGYEIEFALKIDGSIDYSTVVVSFPCKVPEGTPIEADVDWKTQLEFVQYLQKIWSDNAVSCTVYYKKEDIPAIKEYLKHNFRHNIKSVSFLLASGHGFAQAPYETITEQQYLEMSSKTRPITSAIVSDFEVDECLTGACPIK